VGTIIIVSSHLVGTKKGSKMTIGNRIKKVRGGLSREEFALKIGADKSTIQRYEQYNNIPKGDILQRIYEQFNVNIHWLLTGEGEPFPEEKDVDAVFVRNQKEVYSVEYKTQTTGDPLIQAIAGLKQIFDSKNAVLIQTLTLNIAAFQMAAKSETKILDQERRIASLERQLQNLTKQIQELQELCSNTTSAKPAAAAIRSKKI